MAKKIAECPHCKSNRGLFTTFKGVQYYNFDGTENGYNEDRSTETVWAYCISCGKPVCRTAELKN